MTQPNILFICTDQHRFDAMGAYGNDEIETPNLDRLAADGTLFENCYVPNPVCAPTRASFMTGQYARAHGLWANGVSLPEHQPMVTKTLAEAGYDCGLVGKLHLNACFGGRKELRRDDGIRVFRWAHDPAHGSPDNRYHQWLNQRWPEVYAATDSDSPASFATVPTDAHYSRWVSEETIDFLRDGRDRNKPFCFIANFFDPHHPFGAPKEYLDRYDPDLLSKPVTKAGELAEKPAIHSVATQRSDAGYERGYQEYSAEELQEAKAAYYAMVTLLDDEVGRILTALDDAGLADNTLVIFSSDHGEMLGDHQLMLKGPMLYECAVRVPLLIRWPGVIPAGQRRSEFVSWVDLAPTIHDAAGLTADRRHQGRSLLALSRGDDAETWRDWALTEYRNSGHSYEPAVHATMLRHDQWKLIVHHGAPATTRDRTGELYHLGTDPGELHNLWDDPTVADAKTALHEMLLDVLVATEPRHGKREAEW